MAKTKQKPTQSAADSLPENALMIPLASVVEYDGNPRKNDHAVDQMADLIAAHGFRVPVLIQRAEDGENYTLIDGHLRVKAARTLGLVDIPAILCDDMPEAQVAAFRVAVNRAAELAEWDPAKLSAEIEKVRVSFDNAITLTGFDDDSLSALSASPVAAPGSNSRSEPVSRSADRKKATRDTDNVTLSLDMTASEREEALSGLEALRKARGIDKNSEIVLRLIREAQGVAVPKPRTRARS